MGGGGFLGPCEPGGFPGVAVGCDAVLLTPDSAHKHVGHASGPFARELRTRMSTYPVSSIFTVPPKEMVL